MKIDWTVRRWERVTLAIIGLISVALALVACAGWREARSAPIVMRHVVPTAELARPLRIVLVSDAHVGGWPNALDASRLSSAVGRIMDERPDLVVIAGDSVAAVGDTKGGMEAALSPYSALSATYGVIGVLGNHDYDAGDARALATAMRRARIVPLVNDRVDLGPVFVVGLDDLWEGSSDVGAVQSAIAEAKGRPVIAISHNPDILPDIPKAVALTLAGHTHGGHVMIPGWGQIASSSRYGARYRRGEIVEDGKRMIVTSGLGGVATRIGAPPEIVVIDLIPKEALAADGR